MAILAALFGVLMLAIEPLLASIFWTINLATSARG